MFESFKRMFCKHDYKQVYKIICKYVNRDGNLLDKEIFFYICPKCGKRLAILDEEYYYSKIIKDQIKLWLGYEIDFDFSSQSKNTKDDNAN